MGEYDWLEKKQWPWILWDVSEGMGRLSMDDRMTRGYVNAYNEVVSKQRKPSPSERMRKDCGLKVMKISKT